LTGQERTLAAINGEHIDRPPFDFFAEDSALNRLFAYIGNNDLETFLDDMEVDIRGFQAIEPEYKQLGEGVYENMWGERFKYRPDEWGQMREDTYGALYNAESLDEISAFPWPDNDVMDYSKLYEQILKARDKKLAVRYGFADIWQRPAMVRGLENHFADMAGSPENVHYLSRIFTDFYLEDYRRAWEASRGEIDIFFVISDLGTQRGPMISQKMFDEFIAPYLIEMAETIHNFGAKIMFHSCGDISSFIPAIINCGVDILHPIQPVNINMSPENLKRYSGQISFHGGIDVQWLLPKGSVSEIQNEIKRYSSILSPGYIACAAHNFQPDTPAENMIAFFQAFTGHAK